MTLPELLLLVSNIVDNQYFDYNYYAISQLLQLYSYKYKKPEEIFFRLCNSLLMIALVRSNANITNF